MFLFSFGCVVFFRALLLLFCFDCEFLLDFVFILLQRKLVLFREARGGGGNEG